MSAKARVKFDITDARTLQFYLKKQILISIIAVLQYIVKTLLIKVAKLRKPFTTKGFNRHLADGSSILILCDIHNLPSIYFLKRICLFFFMIA